MKGREGKAAHPTDLLVCFPSRAHLSLMPKQICSPVRTTEASKRHNHNLHLARVSNKGGGQGSPLLWAKTKANMGSSELDEPTSPKVTCAGQIKVRPKSGRSCKNWQSVMEEIERIHSHRSSSKHKKKATWVEALGFKKDVMQFLTCLRGFRFDLRCFGNFHGSGVISDDDEDEDESEVGVDGTTDHDGSSSKTVFSKWFMVLQEENKQNILNKEKNGCEEEDEDEEEEKDENGDYFPSAPPPNALLLMRCRSAPAKSWLEEKEEEERQQQKEKEEHEEESKKLKLLLEEEKKNESLIVKCYSPDFFKVSSDIAKETWVVGGMRDPRDPLSRSRSWKR